MKKIIFSIAAIALLGLSSCQSKLDIPQKSTLDFETYYEGIDGEDAQSLIAAAYRTVWTGVYPAIAWISLDGLSDDHFAGGGSFADASDQMQEIACYIMTSNANPLNVVYRGCYTVNYYCNCIIEKIPESSDPAIKQIKAEAKFLRALAHFEAVRWWGTPPLVDHLESPEEYYPSNGDTQEIIDWCIKNMKEASADLPVVALGEQSKLGGRISKYAALAYAGKVGVWYGTRYNKPEYVAAAVEPLKAVIECGNYKLIDDMSILFRKQADFCTEYLFEHDAADNDGYIGTYQADNRNTYFNWAGIYLPTPINTEGWGWDHPTAEFAEWFMAHEGGVEKPRFKSTIATYEQVLNMDYPNANKGVKGDGMAFHEGYFRMRDLHWVDAIYPVGGFWKYSMQNRPYMRYAETLLLYAEAQIRANGDADGSGLKALNEVRKRAELDELTSYTIDTVMDERRAELHGQQERFFDLQRTGLAPERLKGKGTTSPLFKGYKPGTTELWVDYSAAPRGKGWEDKYMLLPFPYNQLAANPNLVQNPGW